MDAWIFFTYRQRYKADLRPEADRLHPTPAILHMLERELAMRARSDASEKGWGAVYYPYIPLTDGLDLDIDAEGRLRAPVVDFKALLIDAWAQWEVLQRTTDSEARIPLVGSIISTTLKAYRRRASLVPRDKKKWQSLNAYTTLIKMGFDQHIAWQQSHANRVFGYS